MDKKTFFIPFQHTVTLEYGQKVTYVSLRRLEVYYVTSDEIGKDIYGPIEQPLNYIVPCKVSYDRCGVVSKTSRFNEVSIYISNIYLSATGMKGFYNGL
jgi:hypothetical protein